MANAATEVASSAEEIDSLPSITSVVEAVAETHLPAAPDPHVEAVFVATRDVAPWAKLLGWVGVIALIYLLITAVAIISRGFRGLSGDVAGTIFGFAASPWVGLFVGVLVTVLIQSSTATTTIAVAAVGTGALSLSSAIPIIMGANVGTTVTTTLIALGYIGNRIEYRRALAASSIHDMYNWLALLIFFPLELLFQPLARASAWMTDQMYGTTWLPNPDDMDFMGAVTRPVRDMVIGWFRPFGDIAGPVVTIVFGAILILLVVKYLGKLLKLLMVGRARSILTRAAGGNEYIAMGTGLGATFITQSSTITASILVPFAGAGILSTKQLYPVTVGANIGTTFTALLAAFALFGEAGAKLGLQAAFVHLLYNLASVLVIYVPPVVRGLPLRAAEWLARIASERKWIIALYLIGCFVLIPLLVIVFVGVL